MEKPEQTPEEIKREHQKLHAEREKKFGPTAHFARYGFIVVGIALTALFLIGGIPKFLLQEKITELAKEKSLPKVRVIHATGIDTPMTLTLPSSLDAINITPIWARVDGYIKTFQHDIGDIVNEGTLLAEIDTPELDQQYEHAVAQLANSKALYDIAKITADRWNTLYKNDRESISKQEVDQYTANLQAAISEVTASQANVERLLKTLEFKRIVAPFDGIIIERDIDIGTLITAGSASFHQQLFKIAKTNILRVFVDVPQRFYRTIQKGLTADVYVSEFPGKTFKGVVARYARALDPIPRTLLTEVHIDNPDYELIVGVYADVKFLLKPDSPYFLIPTSSVLIRPSGPKVAIIDHDDIVRIKNVTLGLDHGKMMEIMSGIEENDRIVANPSDSIIEGQKVELLTK